MRAPDPAAPVSVVIPFLDEERALPGTLEALFAQEGRFEAIAVDGGSRDASRAALARHPAVRVIEAPRGRASQMNAGAAAARGGLLLFLHADGRLPAGAIARLTRLAEAQPEVWGGFRHLFDPNDWRLRLVSRLHNLRCGLTGAFYGDQAMFVGRRLFERAGGFPDRLMEDIALSERLLRMRRPVFLDLSVRSDPRKFMRMGVWRSLGRVALILALDRLGLPYPKAFFRNVR